MNPNYKKSKSENERQYLWRMKDFVYNGDLTWRQLTDIVNSECRKDKSEYRDESAYRKPIRAAEAYYEDVFKHVQDDNFIKEFEKQKDELYKERCKLADQNRAKRTMLRDESRFEVLTQILREEISLLKPIVINDFKKCSNKKKIIAVAQFSDWHSGKLIDNQWNIYNEDVMIERANLIVDKIIEKSNLHNVTDLIIEINGDMIDGLIQVSARNVEEADVIKQIVSVSELLSQLINKLKPHYKTLKVVTTLGNHGRLFESKKSGVTKENFEMLVPEFLKLRLGDDIPIIKSYGLDFTSYTIDNDLICVAHGQNDRLSTVISDFAKMYKTVPKEIHLGHTHEYKDINDCDIYVTVNGCLDGIDDYGLTCRKTTKPAQNLIIYDNDRCIYSLSAV